MKIAEVMSRKVTTVSLNTTLQEAAEKMRVEDIGALPVVSPSEDKIAGMLTDRDIVVRAVAVGKDLAKTHAEEAMTEHIHYVFEDEDLSKATEMMQGKNIRRLVVLNRDKRLVGLVSEADLACKKPDKHFASSKVPREAESPV